MGLKEQTRKAEERYISKRCVDALKANHFRIGEVAGTKISAEILPTHPRLAFLPDEMKQADNWPDNLDERMKKRVKTIEHQEMKGIITRTKRQAQEEVLDKMGFVGKLYRKRLK